MSFIYSTQEIKRRRERIQALMRKENLDALLITNVENFIYFIGVPGAFGLHGSNSRPGIVVLPSEGEPICVVSAYEVPRIRTVVKPGNIKEFTSTLGLSNELLVTALREAGLKKRRVGIEGGLAQRIGMPYMEYVRLLNSFPDVGFIDAAQLIWKMRMIKSDEEISYMKKAAEITGKARQRCFDQIVPGMTYREVATLLTKLMIEAGADNASFIIISSFPQEDMLSNPVRYINLFPDIPIKKGEALNIDAGASVYVYTIDYNRWATIGRASQKLIKYHKIGTQVAEKMADAIKPGATCSDIFQVAQKELKHFGAYPQALKTGRMGHSMGMLFTEPPSITADDYTVLEPGLVLSMEPFAYGERIAFVWEDVWVVREDGPELLTKETHELREIGK